MPTNIEWTQETWNPVTGCTKISAGCRNCYAERMAKRLAGRFGYPDLSDQFNVTLHPDKLEQPLKWKKPRMIFVCSMGDLFHEDVSRDWLYKIFAAMELCPQHTFQILTKRPENMKKWFDYYSVGGFHTREIVHGKANKICGLPETPSGWTKIPWPLPNVWLGVTTENQQAADERIPWLLKTPAAVRFVSVEPMLGPVDFETKGWLFPTVEGGISGKYHKGLDWVICGGETGPGAREMKWEWVDKLHIQCQNAGVPFFFKRVGDAFNGADALKTEALAWKREWPA